MKLIGFIVVTIVLFLALCVLVVKELEVQDARIDALKAQEDFYSVLRIYVDSM